MDGVGTDWQILNFNLAVGIRREGLVIQSTIGFLSGHAELDAAKLSVLFAVHCFHNFQRAEKQLIFHYGFDNFTVRFDFKSMGGFIQRVVCRSRDFLIRVLTDRKFHCQLTVLVGFSGKDDFACGSILNSNLCVRQCFRRHKISFRKFKRAGHNLILHDNLDNLSIFLNGERIGFGV